VKLLLDTHAVVWWWTDDARLPAASRAVIASAESTVLVSAASAWEIATKSRLGKWPEARRTIDEFAALLRRSRFLPLAISIEHARLAGNLDVPLRDPFDRMLIAQSMLEEATVIGGVASFRGLAANVIRA
jgi:PIN domain nuclease of toxin-antitoxin system